MIGPRILYGDLLKDKTVFGNGERTGFPYTNVAHVHLSRTWRSLTASGAYLTFDAGVGATFTADSIAIIAHNLTSAATVKGQMNDTDIWTAPSLDQSGDPTQDIIFLPFTSQSRRFARFYFDDAANPDGFIEIGRIMLCTRWDAAEPIGEGLKLPPEDSTRVTRSDSGQKFADLGTRSRVYAFSMGTMTDETRLALEAISELVGTYDPVVAIPNEELDPLYCTMETIPAFTVAGGWAWTDSGLVLKEAF